MDRQYLSHRYLGVTAIKTRIAAAIGCSLIFFVPTITYGISTQWDLDPISGDWNTPVNWTPDGVPNGPNDIATFGFSNTTDVSLSENTEVNSIIFTPAATNPYSITAGPGTTLTISGVGITNNSGQEQNFVTLGDPSGDFGRIIFSNHATAQGSSILNQGGSTNFFNNSIAGAAGIVNVGLDGVGGSTNFFNNSSAGNAGIFNEGGSTNFFNNSSAGNANISIEDGAFTNFFNNSSAGNAFMHMESGNIQFFDSSSAGGAFMLGEGFVRFHDNSSAGTASINVGEFELVLFTGRSTAGNATITVGNSSLLEFDDLSTAGRATMIANFSRILFEDVSQGGTARVELFIDGSLDISAHAGPGVTIGSLEGDETALIFLGANNLTVGSNNLSTTFPGLIQGTGGSLTKIGTGTLVLSGAHTYTGDTNVNRGVLQVDGSVISNTFVNNGGTLAGIGTINGNVTNLGRVSPGSQGAPGSLTVIGNFTQAQYATLMIQLAGTNTGDFSVLNVLGTANLNGVLDPVLLNGFVPALGDQFTFLNYGSFAGAFRLRNGGIFNNAMERWVVTYQPTFAILTATENVPDQGSTCVLLTLGLLGLVTYRRQLVRKQS